MKLTDKQKENLEMFIIHSMFDRQLRNDEFDYANFTKDISYWIEQNVKIDNEAD